MLFEGFTFAKKSHGRDNLKMKFEKPIRTPWRDFPDVLIHANESAVKQHLNYAAAKAGLWRI